MLVSVIIPCYNVENYVSDCIKSVLAQTYRDIEIICVDNNSTDKTMSALTRFATEYSSFITVLQEKTKGAPAARNAGIAEAKGEYIQFLDADDMLEPEKILMQMVLVEKNNYPEIIVGESYRIDINGKKKHLTVETKDPWMGLLHTKLGNTCANLFRTSAIKAIDGFDTTLNSSQEYNLMFRLLKNDAKVVHDKNVNTIIRDRKEGSISQLNVKENWVRYVDLRKDIINYLLTKDIDKTRMQKYYQALFHSIRTLYNHAPELALAAHDELIPKGFKPKKSAVNSRSYLIFYNLFGYKKAEKIKAMFK